MYTKELTANDFTTDFGEGYTFPFFEDENGNGLYGFGHIDQSVFAYLVNDYDQFCDARHFDGEDYTSEDVFHGYGHGVILVSGEITFAFCSSTDENSVQVTWISR